MYVTFFHYANNENQYQNYITNDMNRTNDIIKFDYKKIFVLNK